MLLCVLAICIAGLNEVFINIYLKSELWKDCSTLLSEFWVEIKMLQVLNQNSIFGLLIRYCISKFSTFKNFGNHGFLWKQKTKGQILKPSFLLNCEINVEIQQTVFHCYYSVRKEIFADIFFKFFFLDYVKAKKEMMLNFMEIIQGTSQNLFFKFTDYVLLQVESFTKLWKLLTENVL